MRRTLLTLVFVAAAGTAGAQTVQAPAQGTMTDDTPINTQIANAPIPLSAAAATAQKRIEMDGYSDVQGLAKGPDGLWQGTAMRGKTSVQVTVDHAGNVAAK